MKAAYRSLGPAGLLASIAGVVCAIILIFSLWAFSASILGANPPAAAGAGDTQGLAAAHDAAYEGYLGQFSGRSLFLVPGAPKPPEPIAVKPSDEPKAPEKPASYDGSPIIAMVINPVWFADGKRLSVGDEPKDDTEVLEVQAPWDAV